MGQIGGVAADQSLTGFVVYLGGLLPLDPGPAYLINISPGQSPMTQLDAGNRFVFSDVTPGKYAIVLWTPHRSELVPDPDKPGQELLITVMADKVLDLGVLVARLPI